MTRVLTLSGSLRAGSLNARLLRAAARLAPAGAELVPWTQLKAVPPFDEDDEAAPGFTVQTLRRAVAAADAVMIATPEYNHSVPGQLKNALDWLSRPYATSALRGKPVAVVGASTGPFGAVWAQAEVRKVLEATGADVLDAELPVGQAHELLSRDGRLEDPDLAAALADVVHALVARTNKEMAA